jgi:tetratricopeptide (TPR) repeat protein
VNAQAAVQLERAIDEALARHDLESAETLASRYQAAARSSADDLSPAQAPWFRADYLAAQVALAAGQLELALERVRPPLELAPQLPAALAGRLRLLAAEALARLRRFPEAADHLAEARVVLRPLPLSPALQTRELRIRLWLEGTDTLGDDLAACARSLEAAGDRANLVLLLCEEGRVWEARGDVERAEGCWRRAEEYGRGLGADPARADVLLQLGRLDHFRGHLQSALDRYETALAAAAAPQKVEIELRRLLLLLDLNQWDRVRGAFASLMRPFQRGELPEEIRGLAGLLKALLEGTTEGGSAEQRAYQATTRGEAEAARARYLQALAEAPAPARRARLALAVGMLALAGGNRTEAESWLRQAEQLARQGDLPEVLWRALQSQGRVAAELDGDDIRARRCFEEAVLVSESQAARLRHRTDAAAYHLHRAGVLRDLLRAACRRGDAARVFHYQELERGRLLWELWCAAPQRPRQAPSAELLALDREAEACARQLEQAGESPPLELLQRCQELLLRRDRLLDDFLRDRSRRSEAALPALPTLAELEQALPPGTVYVAPSLLEDELYLLVVRPGEGSRLVRAPGTGKSVGEEVGRFRRCVEVQLERYRRGFPVGPAERAELDGCLDELGHGPLGAALAEVLYSDCGGAERLLWVADGALHGLPVHALRRHGRYLVEKRDVVHTFGGALLVQQARTPRSWWRRFRPAMVVTEAPSELPMAAREGGGVAASFVRCRTLHGPAATRDAIRRRLKRTSAIHFACHASFDARHPLAACIDLPSGESWRALEWLQEPADGLPLVTLSACRSAAVAAVLGREVFGLVTGLLAAGVRGVLAGLWSVADRETLLLMWRFYRQRLTCDPATALARAQSETLATPAGSPLFWAPFAFFGDPGALPPPAPWRRWWARWRQRRLARRFPIPAAEPSCGDHP